MHYFIVIIIVAIIVTWQILSFINNRQKLLVLKSIFPKNHLNFELLQDHNNCEIKAPHNNGVFEVIISSLNNYLNNNINAVSDFHLMKDIVERNCDAIEDEINAQIPVPLYLGLAGTMLGILIGVGFLVFAGDLEDLLNSGSSSGAEGIKTLLGGVALAMISSIIGIMLTTYGSHIAKNAKSDLEKHKNTFLSWIQAELLPNISTDASSALVQMTRNLTTFNSTFSENTNELKSALAYVNESYQKQSEIINAINQLKIEDIAYANIKVYDKLKKSTNEIEVFAQYLQTSNEYLTNIKELNKKLDDYEKRTQVIENAGRFYSKNEKWLAENFDLANLEVQSALERFQSITSNSFTKLQESLSRQILSLDGILQEQQKRLNDALITQNNTFNESLKNINLIFAKEMINHQSVLQHKFLETSTLIEEIKNLTHIKEGIRDFKESTLRQNEKIEALTSEIRALVKVNTGRGIDNQLIIIPKWMKILILTFCSLIALACVLFIVFIITHMLGI